MNTQHTPEPWRYDYEVGYCGEIIGQTKIVCAFTEEPSEADASRIVACVNACAGLSDGDFAGFKLLGGIKKYIAELLEQRSKAEQQRDELLSAMKQIAEYPRTQGHEFSAAGLRFLAREAIAKAGGDV